MISDRIRYFCSMSTNQIQCPQCGHQFDVEQVLAHAAEARIKQDYERKFALYADEIKKQREALEADQEKMRKYKEQEKEIHEKKLEEAKKELKLSLEKEAEAKIQGKVQLMQEELEKKNLESAVWREKEIAMLRREQEWKEKEQLMQLDLEKQFMSRMQSETERIQKLETERHEMKIREMEKKLEDQIKLAEAMKRKAEQGSMQLQGEVQELAIEQWLKEHFPLDEIREIKKGQRGGDILQIIHTRDQVNIGSIYYESKRTKDFQKNWIAKFKDDMRVQGAQFGVLVTDVLPIGQERLTEVEGIWIATYDEFKALCFVLRNAVERISFATQSQENKGDKMHMLYDYLTGSEFRMQIEAIVEGFSGLKLQLDKEKRAMELQWKEREKQIEKVINNTIHMYGAVKGIAGSAVQSIPLLEMPEG